MIEIEKDYKKLKRELVKLLKIEGLDVYTNTKAHGNQGFFRADRIDISKNITPKRACQVIAHEYAHYVHYKIEPSMLQNFGSLEKIFLTPEIFEIQNELTKVTNFVDKNSTMNKLIRFKDEITVKIKEQEKIIKNDFPNFQHTKKFAQFDKFIKHHKAKFFLKYDRVKYVTPFLHKTELYNIKDIDTDFPEIPDAFKAYLKMLSLKRARNRVNSRICKITKYYNRPNELFARFVEGLTIDYDHIKTIAPYTYERYLQLSNDGYFLNLNKIVEKIVCFG